ncbi:MAG TPA: glycosyltransferase, partial [Stellaceae bacterium]|nr:glycosyltransferase [Stellaceae bacterium]
MQYKARSIDPAALAVAAQAPELALVVPTLNERGNIEPFLELVDSVLEGVAWEVIFVDDDSRDGTADLVRTI